MLAPEPVKGPQLLLIAILGLFVNLFVAFVLGSHHHEEHEDANVDSALLHVLSDAISSAGVIAAAIIIWRTGWTTADPLVSILIGVIILAGSWRIIISSAHILMGGISKCFNLKDVER